MILIPSFSRLSDNGLPGLPPARKRLRKRLRSISHTERFWITAYAVLIAILAGVVRVRRKKGGARRNMFNKGGSVTGRRKIRVTPLFQISEVT